MTNLTLLILLVCTFTHILVCACMYIYMQIYGRIYTKQILITLGKEENWYIYIKENVYFLLYTLFYIT